MFNSTKCYLTVACITYYQDKFDYNCYQLRVLRWLKDNILSVEDVKEYEEISPIIVEKINEKPDKLIVYKDLFYNVIIAITSLVEERNYKLAYRVYKSHLEELKKMCYNNKPKRG